MADFYVRWTGHFSLNDLYSSGHWRTRNNLKKKWKPIFTEAIQKADVSKMEKYKLHIRYNSRLDPSNVTGMLKILEDALQEMGLTKDDSKKYCRGVSVEPDESLKSKEYVAELTKVE